MSETKWTKGPWRAEVKPHVLIHNVYGRKHPDGGDYAPLFSTTNEANAHLIAAAPEMYDELERLVSIIEDHEYAQYGIKSGTDESQCFETYKLLAKARGEQ